jgi:ectoine hydroxylase-related dioxygenase (phytanoyl-CoA dioxygenase family)
VKLTPEQIGEWHADGYLMLQGLFAPDEVDLLLKIARADQTRLQAREMRDAHGGVSRLALRNELYDDTYSAFVRCRRVVDAMEQLLHDEVYHFHHKMMLKEPHVGGAWEWHQDYGYWYDNSACLFPDMGSCMIAVDRAVRENGCLQVIRGSHRIGRINHGKAGDQAGADLERVEAALQRMELVYCEMEPGTALFFHGNLLHRSDQNRSANPRWSLIGCYNTRHNDPFKILPRGHARYSPLDKWPDEKVRETALREWAGMQNQARIREPVS